MHTLLQDLLYSLRLLRKNLGFATVAVLTIAIGIGGTCSIFAVVNAVLLQPLPYRNPDQLLSLSEVDQGRGLTGIPVSWPKLERVQQGNRTMAQVAGFFPTTISLKAEGTPEVLSAAQVTANIFDVFATAPQLGRVFRPEEDAPGGPPVAIVSHALWVSRLGGDPTVIGRAITLNGTPTLVVGVLPAKFSFPFLQPEPDVWLPRVFENVMLGPVKVHTGAGYMFVYARMKPGVSISAVQSELKAIDAGYKHDNPAFPDSPEDLKAEPLKENLVGPIRASLLVLLAAVTSVLLIGCSNLTNLLLVKANGRRKELAIRTAVGATRVRLVRQMLTESVVLAAIGGALGILLAAGTKKLLTLLPDGTLPRVDEVAFNPGILLFSVVLTLGTGIFFGLLPALRASGRDIHLSLKESTRGTSTGRRAGYTRTALVGAEVAMAVLLLTGAGVLLRSFSKLAQVDPGFEPRHVVSMTVQLPPEQYPAGKQRDFFRKLLPSVQGLPRVEAAAAANALPLVGVTPMVYCCAEGAACKGVGKDPLISVRQVTPDFFKTMGIPLLRGRFFNDSDNEQGLRVAIVNEMAAKVFFPGQDPIGRWVASSREMQPLVIVGVVKDVRINALSAPVFQEVYTPHGQQNTLSFPSMTLVVRSDSAPQTMAEAVKRKVADLDPDVPVANVESVDDALASTIAQPRLTMQVGGLFAFLALMLTLIGIYGVLAYSVSEQTQAIGIRMALGATPGRVVALVVGGGLRIILAGLVVGLTASLLLTRLLQSLLFGTSARDPVTLLLTTATVLGAGLLACYIPARRASRVSPASALQE